MVRGRYECTQGEVGRLGGKEGDTQAGAEDRGRQGREGKGERREGRSGERQKEAARRKRLREAETLKLRERQAEKQRYSFTRSTCWEPGPVSPGDRAVRKTDTI